MRHLGKTREIHDEKGVLVKLVVERHNKHRRVPRRRIYNQRVKKLLVYLWDS